VSHARAWFYALIAAIFLFGVSVAALRYEEARAEGVPLTTVLAATTFLVFVTLVPGLLAKEVFVNLVPIEELRRRRRLLRRYIQDAHKRQKKAEHELDQIVLKRDWHRQESDRLRAVYMLAYREAGGTLDNPYR
jgi:hypothetical protein